MNDYEFDWAKEILGDYNGFSKPEPKPVVDDYERSAKFSSKFDKLLDNYNDDLLDTSSFKKIEQPKYVREPTGAKTYKPSTIYGVDDKYKNYKPDFSNNYTYTKPK